MIRDSVCLTLNSIHQRLVSVLIPTVPALALDVLQRDTAIELGFLLVAEMAQTIPLA